MGKIFLALKQGFFSTNNRYFNGVPLERNKKYVIDNKQS